MVLLDLTIRTQDKNSCMIGTEEFINKSTRIISASMIYDKNKGLRLFFSEKCIKLCDYENSQICVKSVSKHKKI